MVYRYCKDIFKKQSSTPHHQGNLLRFNDWKQSNGVYGTGDHYAGLGSGSAALAMHRSAY